MLLRCLTIGLIGVFFSFAKAQNAPITSVPEFYGKVAGEVIVPVTVSDFNSIGAISLNLQYDPAVMTFVEGMKNDALTGLFAVGDNLLPSGMRSIAIGWFGTELNLPDGSVLVNLKFDFIGGTTNLIWFDDGASCEYTDGSYNALTDLPTACHYQNGIVSSSKRLNLTVLLEGLYNPVTHQMSSAIESFAGPCTIGRSDYIQLELHNAADYSIIEFSSPDYELSVNGTATILIPPALNGSYYITVRHRNSIATVSAIPVSLSGTLLNYNFTNQASMAYGNNMLQMSDGKWALYGGDVNQDGFIDTGDMSPVDNDASNFASGYLATDINGDGMTDTADMTTIDNNAANFIGSITP